ncbi:hypothetical protein EWM64_g3123 [Hericium alpestre]|uniref:PRA1 family protein n=1 Tax=Hericium alpestre TaxID=135208 RepID=A0A4Z0A1E7_9AGAM|nr:hypothetical protein EWM64_g3123 [Hericium alpestre]
MEYALRAADTLKSFRETRLSALRPPQEFFDHNRVSRPSDFNQAVSRISYNTRYFSGNYGLIIAVLAVYAMITNPLLLLSLGFLIGGFAAINKWDHMTRTVRVPQAVFARLQRMLRDDRQIVEATAVVAGYNFTTRVLRALDVAGLAEEEVPIPSVE